MKTWQDIFARPKPGLVKTASAHIGWVMLSAVLLLLAFPSPGWGWLAHIALVPVTVLAIRSTSPRILAVCIYGVFSVWWIWMIRWLWPVTGGGEIGLAMFMAAYWTVALLLVRHLHRAFRSAMVLTLPLVWVSFELLRGSAPQGGFGWFCLGHAMAPYMPEHQPGTIIQIADLFGQPGVSFLVVMTNGLIVDMLTRSLLKRREQNGKVHTRVRRTIAIGTGLWVVSMLGAMGYGLLAFRQEAAATQRTVQVAVVQTAVTQSNKDAAREHDTDPDDPQNLKHHQKLLEAEEADWQRLQEMTRQAAAMNPKPEMIVWPETMVPRPINPQAVSVFREFHSEEIRSWARYTEQISFLSASLQTNLVVGASSMVFKLDRDEPYTSNSVFVYDWRGVQYPEHYDKMHRVPFGEYIPWVSSWPWLKRMFITYLSPYDFDYSLVPGERVKVFPITPLPQNDLSATQAGGQPATQPTTQPTTQVATQPSSQPNAQTAVPSSFEAPLRIVTPICFEDSVPRLVRSMVYNTSTGQKQADVLVNLTNDGWFASTDQPLQHLQIASLRSIELRVPTARAVNMGVSGFVDSMGRIGPLVQQDGVYQDVPGIATAQIKIDRRETFYGSAGPLGSIIISVFTGVLVIAGIFRRIRRVGDRRDVV